MIVRGTTPTHKFALPFTPIDISDAIVTYQQNGVTVINRRLDSVDIDMTTSSLCVALSQEETLSFSYGDRYIDNIVNIQIRVIKADGTVYASRIIREKVSDILWEEIMTAKPIEEDIVYYDGGGTAGYGY